LKGLPSVNVIETDDYGRTLVSYEGYNEFTEKDECVYVICQKYENSTVYFYEDINYEWIGKETTDIEGFKNNNDWGKYFINESKLSGRKIHVSFDMKLVNDSPFSNNPSSSKSFSNEKYRKSLSDNCGIEWDSIVSGVDCDWDGNDQVLNVYCLDNGDKYFVITDIEYNTYAAKIEDPYNTHETVRALKEQSGWHYGT
jgi:hypothetical protein